MRFLLDANLSRSLAGRIAALGHDAIDVRDIGLRSASDSEIAAHARRHQLTLITPDFDFAGVRNYPPADYAGLIVVDLPNEMPVDAVDGVIEALIREAALLATLPGKLAIVQAGRVRLRAR